MQSRILVQANTVYIEAFLRKLKLMLSQPVLSQLVGQPAERFLDAGLRASSTGIREGWAVGNIFLAC